MGLLTFSINVTLDGCVDHTTRESDAKKDRHFQVGQVNNLDEFDR
jgi:hypothetical protein